MKNLPLTALILALAGYAAAAGPVASEAPDAGAAFAAPIAQTMMAVGTERVAGMGSASLANLSQLMLETPAAAASPEAFARLGKALAARGVTLEDFNAMDSGRRAAVLKEAADDAEQAAAAQAAAAVKFYSADLDPKKAEELLSAFDLLTSKNIDLYLSPQAREAVTTARASLSGIAERPARERRAFYDSLGKKLVDGAFTDANTFVKSADGWRFADYGPDSPVFGTLEQAVTARLEIAHQLPDGPWKQDVSGATLSALRRPELVAQLGLNDASLNSMRAQAASQWEESLAGTPRLQRAAAEMRSWSETGKTPSYGAVQAMSKHYDEAAESWRGGLIENMRVAAGLLKGRPEAGYPSIDSLDTLRRQMGARYHRAMGWSLVGIIGTGLAMAANASAQAYLAFFAGGPVFVALTALMALILAVWSVSFWRRDNLTTFSFDLTQAKISVDIFEERAFPPKEDEHRHKRVSF